MKLFELQKWILNNIDMILKLQAIEKIKKFKWHWDEEQTILRHPPNKSTRQPSNWTSYNLTLDKKPLDNKPQEKRPNTIDP